jgi:hypothetical protein
MATPRGVDLRESGNGLLARARCLNAAGNPLGAGAESVVLRVSYYAEDGTLHQGDFGANPGADPITFWAAADAHAFVNPALALAAQPLPDGTATGLWSYLLAQAACVNFVAGRIYNTHFSHSGMPVPVIREFQWGGVEGDAGAGGGGGPTDLTPVLTAIGGVQVTASATGTAVSTLLAGLVRVPTGTVVEATATQLTVAGLAGQDGQYRGARVRVVFADGTIEPAGSCSADVPAPGGNRTLTVPPLTRVPVADDTVEVFG